MSFDINDVKVILEELRSYRFSLLSISKFKLFRIIRTLIKFKKIVYFHATSHKNICHLLVHLLYILFYKHYLTSTTKNVLYTARVLYYISNPYDNINNIHLKICHYFLLKFFGVLKQVIYTSIELNFWIKKFAILLFPSVILYINYKTFFLSLCIFKRFRDLLCIFKKDYLTHYNLINLQIKTLWEYIIRYFGLTNLTNQVKIKLFKNFRKTLTRYIQLDYHTKNIRIIKKKKLIKNIKVLLGSRIKKIYDLNRKILKAKDFFKTPRYHNKRRLRNTRVGIKYGLH
mmetsp:Transcript_15178/g.21301  ORF Transcript_15178/g.21301 Transcript_15178/m.21301 type:complete len:286 (+) Transcript_15178:35-892(+)